jgi:dTMP kinase
VEPLPKRATLIVIEGIDGSGKTTLGRSLVERLQADGHNVRWYPNKNLAPVRSALDGIARGRGFADRFEMLGRDQAQFLAAALKLRDMLDLAPDLADEGLVMVMDRYYYSHLALALVMRTANEARLRRLYQVLPTPDLLLLVNVSPPIALQRVTARGTDSNTLQFLRDFADAYENLAERDPHFTVVSGEREPDAVLADVVERAQALLRAHA